MLSLYRKYRPIVFADIAGQEHIKQTLTNQIVSGSTVHAYLFCGPRAVGKTTTARIFARALNCLKRKAKQADPCNACDECKAILDNATLDIMEIDAASNTGVDNVRDTIIAAARVGNSFLTKKVFIIDEVHMLSLSAFNALLKLIEEPPSHVVFVLATTELHKIPATILSRCQRFDFKKISPDDSMARLQVLCAHEGRICEDELLERIIKLSDGFQRDAEVLLGQVLSVPTKTVSLADAAPLFPFSNSELVKEYCKSMIEQSAKSGLGAIRSALDQGCDAIVFLNDAIDYMRDCMLRSYGVDISDRWTKGQLQQIDSVVHNVKPAHLTALIDYLIDAHKEIRFCPRPFLPIEMALIRAASLSSQS